MSMSTSLLRPISRAMPLHPTRRLARHASTKHVHRLPGTEEEPADFRPPWFYAMARSLTWTLIPGAGLYGVFFYDFGDHDHVFRPARVWLDARKKEFFELSPEEQKLLEQQKTPTTASQEADS